MCHLPATTVAGRRLAWPDAGDVGSPFGSPISLVPLTFNKHERRPETSHCSRPERPSGSDRGRARCPATCPPAVSAPDRRRKALGKDRDLLDEVWRRLSDAALLERPDFIESLRQMRRGEGTVLRPLRQNDAPGH
jgi:hypothetical protein